MRKKARQAKIAEIDQDGNGSFTFEEFLSFMEGEQVNDEEEDPELRAAFKKFDKDGNGVIDATELRDAMVSMGEQVTEEDVERMLKEADADNDGQINFREFVKIIHSN
ncbi:hypothetical protein FBU59_005642 [Linderina macrospora]|uniref:Uncharacterized protein n=1 Tax=Linderina macrospora TaxID=4868 RepID=A0ACC1J2C5_9FUNG|nr:hypothetical protein FBU59_005642 [Linderina macrospora]